MTPYLYAEQQGNKIFHKYIGEDGKRREEVITSFPIELYIPGRSSDGLALDGSSLSRVEFSDIDDASEFIKTHSDAIGIYGQTSLVHQFLAKKYPGSLSFNVSDLNIVFVDIENMFLDGFPDPSRADQEITAITLKSSNDNKTITFSCVDYVPKSDQHHVRSNNEEELLASFLDYWSTMKVDIITGWNVNGYDVPYIINRLTNVLGEKQAAKLSPFHTRTSRVFREVKLQNDQIGYRILGITIYDYLELYKKFSLQTLEKYTLDHVAYVELGENKLDYSEYANLMELYKKDPQKYIQYNIQDVLLVERLDKKLNLMFIALTMTYLAKVRHYEIFGPVKLWDNLIYVNLLKRGVQIPPQKHHRLTDQIEGGFVKEAIPGLYKWLVSFDLTSLYPSIMMALGMSPETIRGNATGNAVHGLIDMGVDLSWLKEQNLSMAANGSTYSRTITGIIPTLIEEMFNDRKRYKGMMLDTKKEIESIKHELDARGVAYEH